MGEGDILMSTGSEMPEVQLLRFVYKMSIVIMHKQLNYVKLI